MGEHMSKGQVLAQRVAEHKKGVGLVAGAAALALVALLVVPAVTGRSLLSDAAVAARVNGVAIPEGDVTDLVLMHRHLAGLDDDEAWGAWLEHQSSSSYVVRDDALSALVQAELVRQVAEQRGVRVSDQEVDAAIARTRADFFASYAAQHPEETDEGKRTVALEHVGDAPGEVAEIDECTCAYCDAEGGVHLVPVSAAGLECAWQDALATSGYDEEAYRAFMRTSLLEGQLEALAAEQGDVAWYDAFAPDRTIQTEPAPSSLPY